MESGFSSQLRLQGVGMENAKMTHGFYKNHFKPLICITKAS
jgi:hypothetical protein